MIEIWLFRLKSVFLWSEILLQRANLHVVQKDYIIYRKGYQNNKIMRLRQLLFILYAASVLQIPFSSVHAQEKNNAFMVPVHTSEGKVPMAFRKSKSPYSIAVGYEEYNRPAVPIETKGEVFIPDSVDTPDGMRLQICWISRGSFQCCRDITKIHLPSTVETISDLAFQDCKSLREITLPDNLHIIYPQAFSGCDALRRIFLRSSNPPITYPGGTFEEKLMSTTTIVYPAASADKYQKDHLFSRFRYHTEFIPTYPSEE